MIWILLIALALATGLALIGPLLKSGETPPTRKWMAACLCGFIALALWVYALIGSPNLAHKTALTPYTSPPDIAASGPSEAEIKAAQNMSPEERMTMIIAMVDGLAAKLEDTPDNPQGWMRLLRARTVLGQDDQKAADINTVKKIYVDRPDIQAQILEAVQP